MKRVIGIACILVLMVGSGIYAEDTYPDVNVIYHQNTFPDQTNTEVFSYGQTSYRISAQAFDKHGYVLTSYTTASDGSGDQYLPNGYFNYYWLLDDYPSIDLYAQWEPIDETYGGVIFIGDSYSVHAGWPIVAKEQAGITSCLVRDLGGTGFVNGVEDDRGNKITFGTLLAEAITIVGKSNTKDYQWLVVEGGYNDQYYSDEEIIEAITSFVQTARKALPNVHIILGMNGDHSANQDVKNQLVRVHSAYKKAAEENHIYYLEGIETVLESNQAYFAEDGYHPNSEGGYRLGYHTGEYLKKVNEDRLASQTSVIKEKKTGAVFGVIGILLVIALLRWQLWKRKKAIRGL